MISQQELNNAIAIWLDYEDSNKYDDEKARACMRARITVREALRSGCIILNPEEFNRDSAAACFVAVNKAIKEAQR